LYPFARMTGGIYYEHAHRLFGALVGLTTLILSVFLARTESRPWVRRLGWIALVMVIVQGLLGGL
ncbi:MAG: cytochrome oxidase biogenesis protein CtaA, partial [Gammaproteobacteria bacterium]|nr:cytochrome oxidase biogenesis protein CtaA [Gammaproteobacteria bacterium]